MFKSGLNVYSIAALSSLSSNDSMMFTGLESHELLKLLIVQTFCLVMKITLLLSSWCLAPTIEPLFFSTLEGNQQWA